MKKMTPCLTFNRNAEQAAKFYVSIFKNSKILQTTYYTENMPMRKGTVLTVRFKLNGQEFIALNAGPSFKFTEAISMMVNCDTQKEIDTMWKKLSAGGKKIQCGWLTDKFGVTWQVCPSQLGQWMKDKKRLARIMQAVMKMTKLDLEVLKNA